MGGGVAIFLQNCLKFEQNRNFEWTQKWEEFYEKIL